ncbi:hypothetical protein BU15DRAFT_86928 [Melanogaster broomeanus]|nr:hypothetical protein BU15DRAFT_86928 [Melanogaster broomeanus]
MAILASALADLATKAQARIIRSHSYSDSPAPSSDASECSSRSTHTERSHLSPPTIPRANEHLAVLLPKNLWKHCRKCGGVFCHQCTSRVTYLLDVLQSRLPPSSPQLTSPTTTASPSPTSSICASPIEQSYLLTRGIRVRSSSQLSTSNVPSVMISVTSELEASEPSFGELDAYPLRRSSIICKATGGGRWEPKHTPPLIGLRIPGCKAPYEIDMENEDAEERRRRLNPIVRDGEFQYRFRQDRIPPASLARSPFRLSTF